jgi:hypothetical protein
MLPKKEGYGQKGDVSTFADSFLDEIDKRKEWIESGSLCCGVFMQ